jgi:hypothetical protein
MPNCPVCWRTSSDKLSLTGLGQNDVVRMLREFAYLT